MTNLRLTTMAGLGLLLTAGCPNDTKQPPGPTERPSLTSAECQAKGGTIVGDIGDGAIHRPDYRCANGEPPLGTIVAEAGGPVAVEGAVCCPSSP